MDIKTFARCLHLVGVLDIRKAGFKQANNWSLETQETRDYYLMQAEMIKDGSIGNPFVFEAPVDDEQEPLPNQELDLGTVADKVIEQRDSEVGELSWEPEGGLGEDPEFVKVTPQVRHDEIEAAIERPTIEIEDEKQQVVVEHLVRDNQVRYEHR